MLLSLVVLVAATLGGLFLGVPSTGRAIDEKAHPSVGRFQAFQLKEGTIAVLDTTNSHLWVSDPLNDKRWEDRGIPAESKK